ncbi:MAG: hypothetical protein Q8Q09_00640 [Deltaproteobacteria bacterium]|nr:hypothetical protein [Deltaproteobacteria bacterium]
MKVLGESASGATRLLLESATVMALWTASACSAPATASDAGSDGAQRRIEPSRQQLLEAFVLWTSCGSNRTASTSEVVAEHMDAMFAPQPVDSWWRPYRIRSLERQYQCVLTAQTCADVQRCMWLGRDPSECNGQTWRCAGDEAIACTDGEFIVDDCASAGEVCGLNSIRSAVECRYPIFTSCSGWGRCGTGERVITCSFDQWNVAQECARLDPGATCRERPTGNPYCRGSGAECTTPGSRCRGSTRVECVGDVGDARERTVDCAQSPYFGRCAGNADVAPCDYTNGQCTMREADRCEGQTLVFCGPGGTSRVDCSQIGFRTCESFGMAARCVP